MEIKVTYNELEDRQTKIKEQEAKRLRMLTDNFDNPNWKSGDLIVGTMTFTDEPSPTPPVIPDSPDVITLKKYLSDPNSGSPSLETTFQVLTRLYLGL